MVSTEQNYPITSIEMHTPVLAVLGLKSRFTTAQQRLDIFDHFGGEEAGHAVFKGSIDGMAFGPRYSADKDGKPWNLVEKAFEEFENRMVEIKQSPPEHDISVPRVESLGKTPLQQAL